MSKKVSFTDQSETSNPKSISKKSIQDSVEKFDRMIASGTNPNGDRIPTGLLSSFFSARKLIEEKALEKEVGEEEITKMMRSEHYKSLKRNDTTNQNKGGGDVGR